MTDDLSTDDLAGDLRDALSGDTEQAAGLDPADEAAGWRIKDRADDTPEPPADAEPPAGGDAVDDIRADIKSALNDAGPDEADAATEAAWAKEQRALADQVLQGLGVDPAERHAKGLSRREVVRRLVAAEHGIRTDPAGALPALIRDYGGRLDEAGKMRLAAGALSALGLEHAGAIGAAERQRLQGYETAEQQRAAALEQARPAVEQQVAAFAAGKPDFQQLRPLMATMVSAGQAQSLEQAYTMARRASGLADQEAQAADAARRDKVAKSRAAGTPQTRNSPGKVGEPHKEQSLRDDLRDTLREQAGY